MRFPAAVAALLLGCGLPASLFALDVVKPKALASAEEMRWVDAVRNRKTLDGASVIEVLRYAEKMRRDRFKVASIEVGYNGGSGEPDGVMICYFIGMKRLNGDEYCDIIYKVKRDGKDFRITAPENPDYKDTTIRILERGRDAFLIEIDERYNDTCFDIATKAKLC